MSSRSVLLLDTSSSMGDTIGGLNNAIRLYKEQACMDEIASRSVDITIIEFNETAQVVQDFTPISQMQPVTLSAKRGTAMGAGINLTVD